MANQITDNRTSVNTAEATTNWTDLAGTASGATVDNEIFIQGSNSLGEYSTNSLFGQMYNFGATNVSNNTFYVWIYCTVVGFLNAKASGGFRIRFAGSTIGDFFEVYVAGNDDWPTAIEGGWVQFVVDIEEAHANSDNTGGTKPATSSVERVGWASLCSSMPRMVDNTWVDQIARLPDATPGIIVEGRNGGSTDWDFDDIATTLGSSVGTFLPNVGGSYKCNTPIQFGINDTSTHGFADTNKIVLMETQEFVPDGFMSLSAALGELGGTTNVDLTLVTVATDAATGSDWDCDFSDANLDTILFTDCNMMNMGNAVLGADVVSDGTRWDVLDMTQDTAQVEGDSVVSTRSATTVASCDDPTFGTATGFNNMSFVQGGAGHALEFTTTGTRTLTNVTGLNADGGYGATAANDAAIFNDSGGLVTINYSGTAPTYRNGTSATTTLVATTDLTFTGLVNPTEVRVYDAGTTTEVDGTENVTTGTVTYSIDSATYPDVDVRIFATAYIPQFLEAIDLTTGDVNIPIVQIFDRVYENP